MMKSTATAAKSKNGALLAAATFFIFVVLARVMISRAPNSSTGAAVEVRVEMPYVEDWVTNPYRSAVELCTAVAEFNASSERQALAADRAAVNAAPFSRENAIHKLKLWSGPTRYTPRERILCLMISQNSLDAHNQKKVAAHYKAWGTRCDKFLLFANTSKMPGVPEEITIEMHPMLGDGDNNVWQKVRHMMQYLRTWPELKNYDFAYIGGDDTYFIPDNLRKLVNEPHYYFAHRMAVPFFLGHRMVSTHDGSVFVSGSGYVLNNVSLKMMTHFVDGSRCKPDVFGGAEDLLLAHCMMEYGAQPMNAADEFDEDRMHAFGPSSMDHVVRTTTEWWYTGYRKRPVPRGLDILSAYSITLHYVEPGDAAEITKHL